MTTWMSALPGPTPRRYRTVVRLALAATCVATVASCSSDDAPAPTATPVATDEPVEVRAAAAAAVDRLLTESTSTETTGTAGGETVEIEAAADPVAGSMRLDETLDATIRSRYVMADGVLYAKIYPVDQNEPPYTVTEPGEQAGDFLAKVYTASGRVFGDVEILSAVLARAPAQVSSLGSRAGDDGGQTGLRFTFDAADVGRLLSDEALERTVMLTEPGEEQIVLDVWFDDRLRELRTSGSMYQDGELIDDVALAIEYQPVDDPGIEIPGDTLPD